MFVPLACLLGQLTRPWSRIRPGSRHCSRASTFEPFVFELGQELVQMITKIECGSDVDAGDICKEEEKIGRRKEEKNRSGRQRDQSGEKKKKKKKCGRGSLYDIYSRRYSRQMDHPPLLSYLSLVPHKLGMSCSLDWDQPTIPTLPNQPRRTVPHPFSPVKFFSYHIASWPSGLLFCLVDVFVSNHAGKNKNHNLFA